MASQPTTDVHVTGDENVRFVFGEKQKEGTRLLELEEEQLDELMRDGCVMAIPLERGNVAKSKADLSTPSTTRDAGS